jgi:hypothetical protein
MSRNGAIVLLFLFSLLIFSAGCMQTEPPTTRPNGRYDSSFYGLSFTYPEEWVLREEQSARNIENINETSSRLLFENTPDGLVVRIGLIRDEYTPTQPGENFQGSEECGYSWTDDRPNLTVVEAYEPTSLGGVKARRFIFILNETTVETLYEVCRTTQPGQSMFYRIFWSAPGQDFFTVEPDVQDLLDSVTFYQPV